MTNPTVWHCLAFRDADAGIKFLTALGFTEQLVVRNETDPSIVEHAQFHFGDNGAVMFGSASLPDRPGSEWDRRVGTGSCYLVVDTDADVAATYERAMAAGARSLQEPRAVPHGGHSAGVEDPEGNQYSIGSYRGEWAGGSTERKSHRPTWIPDLS